MYFIQHTIICSDVVNRAGSVSVFGIGIFVGILFMSVRYSVLVFRNTSVFLKYWLKIANFWYVHHLYLAPLLRVTPSEFHRMMGPQGYEKV